MSPSKTFRWAKSPSLIATKLDHASRAVGPALHVLAQSHAARAEATMKTGAPWSDQTGFARSALYARATGGSSQVMIEIGTTNLEYGIFLELGTIYMAPRPIITPTYHETATTMWRDSILLVRGLLGG